MADLSTISNAATALTEGLKIYGDITDRQRRADAEATFTDKINAAGGVENLSYEDLMGAGDFLSRQEMDLGRYAIQQRQSIDAMEATRKYNEEKLIRDREYKKGVLEEGRTYESEQLTEELARKATEKTEDQVRTAELLTTQQIRDDRLLAEKQTRQDELTAEGRTYEESQKIADREYTEAQAVIKTQESEAKELDEAAVQQKAMDRVTALAEQYGGLNNVPKIQLLPYVDTVKGLEEYLDPKRIVGAADEQVDDVSQMMRDSVFDGDFAEARRIGRKSGISKSGVNAELKTIKADFKKSKNAQEVLNRVVDVMNLPDEAFGVKGQAKDIFQGLLGTLGLGGKPSVFESKMANITVDYATEKLKGVLSNQDMNRIQKIVGDAGILRKGPEEVRQIMGEVQEILERSIDQLRTGKIIKRTESTGDDVFSGLQKPGDTIDLGNGVTMTLKAN